MPKTEQIFLKGGDYQSSALIANAQRCVNLYPEKNPEDAPVPITILLTPGLTLASSNAAGAWRGFYTASNANIYGVAYDKVYRISPTGGLTEIGTIPFLYNPVCMADNGEYVVLVQGSVDGWKIKLEDDTFEKIDDPNFFGGDRVDYLDTFLIFNKPGENQFYSSNSNDLTFDALYYGSKTSSSDPIITFGVVHREIVLLGKYSGEIWINAGNPTFPFETLPGAAIDFGIKAKYSFAKYGSNLFWLGQDKNGTPIVIMLEGYKTSRISNFAIENTISNYGFIEDAVGYTYQQNGHVFYVLNFPAADKTWVYDRTQEFWHERSWMDSNGIEHRHRGQCSTYTGSLILIGDWQNGNLYYFDQNNRTDNLAPIIRRRGFPHLLENADRIMYRQFQANVQCGEFPSADNFLSLRWSDNRGKSFGNPVLQTFGDPGDYNTMVSWSRLGMARDRVFELFWTSPGPTALNGAWVTVDVARS